MSILLIYQKNQLNIQIAHKQGKKSLKKKTANK